MSSKKPNGFVLVTLIKPQPDGRHSDDETLGTQIRLAISDLVTERSFKDVN